jgi:hypothetical protein
LANTIGCAFTYWQQEIKKKNQLHRRTGPATKPTIPFLILTIDRLWSLTFGIGASAGLCATIFQRRKLTFPRDDVLCLESWSHYRASVFHAIHASDQTDSC